MKLGGMDPMELPPDRFFSLAYVWLLGERDEVEKAKFDAKLWLPEKGKAIPKESPWSPENESKAFAAFKAETTGK